MKGKESSEPEFTFTSRLERSDNKLWISHFEVPSRIARELIDGDDRRVVCTINQSETYQCALLHHGEGTFVISVNKALLKKLRCQHGDALEIILKKDRSEYGLPMPEELQELFAIDKKASKLFHGLTKGKQRTLLYIVNSAKSSDKRIERSLIITRHLDRHAGKIDYKKLNAELKNKPL